MICTNSIVLLYTLIYTFSESENLTLIANGTVASWSAYEKQNT